MATATLQSDVEEILKGRKPSFGQFRKMESGSLSLTTQSQPYVDESAMSARAVINTPREDREGDIIIPMGVQLDNYRANPVVLWEHGLGSIDTPIAKCMSPEGKLSLSVTEDEIVATSYFTDKDPISLQIFHLIVEGIVRATSVRAEPIKSFTHKTAAGGAGLTLELWELVEWSWGALGVNPDALAKTLDRGTILGDKICAPLLKSLTAVAPKPTDFFKGITLPKEKTVAEETTDEEVTKTDTVDETTDTTKTDVPEEDTEPSEDVMAMDDTMMEEDDMSVPMGAKVLRSAYSAIKTLKSELEAAAGPLEQADVKQLVAELIETATGMEQAIDGLHSKTYSEMDALSKMDEAEDEETAEAAMKSLKAWLNKGMNKHRLAGIRSELKSFSFAKNLTPAQKKKLAGMFKSIQRVEAEARAQKSDVTTEQYNELVKRVETLTDQLAQALPA